LPPALAGGGMKKGGYDIGFSQILNAIWLKPIFFIILNRPINGTAIDKGNLIMLSFSFSDY
jgi:hypothetical protein